MARRRLSENRMKNQNLYKAVHKNRIFSGRGLLERGFTTLFKGLVYPQIWEDPEVDLEALDLRPGSHVVTIASGGCNVLSYLIDEPARITAVDLNTAHVALTKLKLAAARHLPGHDSFYRFFGQANTRANVRAYERYLKEHLDEETRAYWEKRDLFGRRRIGLFARNLYRAGLLGNFIGMGHLIALFYGRNLKNLLQATSLEEQRYFFDRRIAPLFDKRLIRWMAGKPVSLYGLGIPPAQYAALAASGSGNMSAVLRQRLERLACDFSLQDNYFAWQAFGRSYAADGQGPLPPYLQAANYPAVSAQTGKVEVRHCSFTDFLKQQKRSSLDRFVLLDAQDWMNDAELTGLWSEITRTARPGARVVFRTAAEERLLPGRVPDDILAKWEYDAGYCAELTRRDRSAIYGAVHLYCLEG